MDRKIIELLLRDRTTDKNILWANDDRATQQIIVDDVEFIQERHKKIVSTKNFAHAPAQRFSRRRKFASSKIIWLPCRTENIGKIYVRAKILEITCGEAPYITGRYNAVTGEAIPVELRGGLLDMKLRTIANEVTAPAEQRDWAIIALQSVYAYEFQGDNLFLARRNVFETVEEFLSGKVDLKSLKELLPTVAEIISWNFWQIDGLTNSPPFTESTNLFGGTNCRIKDWTIGEVVEFASLVGSVRRWKILTSFEPFANEVWHYIKKIADKLLPTIFRVR